MRMQSAIKERRQERDAIKKQKRERAISILKFGTKRSDVVKQIGISRTTVDRQYTLRCMHQTTKTQRSFVTQGQPQRAKHCEKSSEVWSDNKRIVYAAEKGFALSNGDVRNIMKQIESNGRCGFRTESGSPSSDTIRHWREVNRDVTYRKSESKDVAKLAAENVECGIIPLRPGLGERRRFCRGSTRRGHTARIDLIRANSRKGRGSLAGCTQSSRSA